MIVWLTGNSGSGKTTLAQAWRRECPSWILLDGDEMRASISLGAGFSREERERHNLRVARLADVLDRQGHNVMVAVIAPFAATRGRINEIINCLWVYIRRASLPMRAERPYEAPEGIPFIDTDRLSVAEEVALLTELINQESNT